MPPLIKGKNDILTVNPELAKEWNYSKNIQLRPDTIAAGSHRKVWWMCKKGHEWLSSPHNRCAGNGCPYCSGKMPIPGETDLQSVHPELAKEWNYERNGSLTPEQVTYGSSKKVWWVCNKGHEWQTTVAHRTAGRGCPVCRGEMSTSFPEQAVYYYIKQVFNDAKNRFKLNLETVQSNSLEIDVYIPSLRLGIEYDGQVFHQDKEKDLNKDNILKTHNIKLIRIREPTCPHLDSSSICIQIEDIKGRFYFERAITNTLTLIKKLFDIDFVIDVDLLRDYSSIQNSYEYTLKSKSIAEVAPHLLDDWDYEKNKKITPKKDIIWVSKVCVVEM